MSDDLAKYREWLSEDDQRMIGMIFLNPFSPHAIGRERGTVINSSQEKIIESYKDASVLNHSRFIPVIYDGPYRYTGRAVDVLENTSEGFSSSIKVISSSHEAGIAKGFAIELSSIKNKDEYNFYQKDFLSVWNKCWLNIPSYGVCLISFPGKYFKWTKKLEEQIGKIGGLLKNEDLQFYPEAQIHIRLLSFMKSNHDALRGPFMLDSDDKHVSVPHNFASEAVSGINFLELDSMSSLEFIFDCISVDKDGFIHLTSENSKRNKNFLATCKRLDCEDFDRPWLTVGRLFDKTTALPLPSKNRPGNFKLSPPIIICTESLSIVHYAYESMLRWIGKLDLQLGESVTLDESMLIKQLHL
jgi:hypothetical protein